MPPPSPPPNPDYAARTRDSFARQPAMALIGATITALEPGFCEVTLPHRDDLTQQHGFIHGGVTGMLADSASGYAGFTLMPHDASPLTVEYKINMLNPAARRQAGRARPGGQARQDPGDHPVRGVRGEG